MEETVLQERKTLDDVVIEAVHTFRNGCNFRLVRELDDCYYLEYGCFGVLINLVSGSESLLYKWLEEGKPLRKLTGSVKPETIEYLLGMKSCECCGGARFRVVA